MERMSRWLACAGARGRSLPPRKTPRPQGPDERRCKGPADRIVDHGAGDLEAAASVGQHHPARDRARRVRRPRPDHRAGGTPGRRRQAARPLHGVRRRKVRRAASSRRSRSPFFGYRLERPGQEPRSWCVRSSPTATTGWCCPSRRGCSSMTSTGRKKDHTTCSPRSRSAPGSAVDRAPRAGRRAASRLRPDGAGLRGRARRVEIAGARVGRRADVPRPQGHATGAALPHRGLRAARRTPASCCSRSRASGARPTAASA